MEGALSFIIKRIIIFVTVLFLTLGLTSCGTFDKAKDMADTAKEKFDEKVEEKKGFYE